MPLQAPQWTEFLNCPVCEYAFELKVRLPISISSGHTICKACLSSLQGGKCSFDQVKFTPFFCPALHIIQYDLFLV